MSLRSIVYPLVSIYFKGYKGGYTSHNRNWVYISALSCISFLRGARNFGASEGYEQVFYHLLI